MIENWIKQADKCITTSAPCSTLLIKFNDDSIGITCDSGETVDITWLRKGAKIYATSGCYSPDDIRAWQVI